MMVLSGNINGFETVGSNIAEASTLSLPTVPVSSLRVAGSSPFFFTDSEPAKAGLRTNFNRSEYSADLAWSRPVGGWPPVTRYYVAFSQDGTAWAPVTGSGYLLRDAIVTSEQSVTYNVPSLQRGVTYYFRVHVGSDDGEISSGGGWGLGSRV
eukprot:750633-Rhodomonas_salina.1